jgi:prepilin-type N-terminal cleavage/methylation domain-containing protein
MRTIRNSGFSLVEVLVAILILGVALVGLTQGITLALGSTKESELQTTAALLAAGQIESLRAEGFIADGESDGECEEGLELYRWKQTISPAGVDGLHEVQVVIEHSRTGKPIFELRTLLFEPPEDSSVSSDNNSSTNNSRRRREAK